MDLIQEEEEIVISGISGKFPQCENIDEFSAKLFAGIDMIHGYEGQFHEDFMKLPRVGLLNDLSKFDAQFFTIHGIQADTMEAQMRMILELSYEAIIDSGYNPEQIRGSNIGVYVGHCGTELNQIWYKVADKDLLPFVSTGHAASLFANRISYSYDLKGASMSIDSSWTSFMIALMEAFKAVKRGDCDGALVAGARLCRSYKTSLSFLNLGVISQSGFSKPFSESANGYVRSEAVGTIFIQKKSLAKRHYATILNLNANIGGSFKMGNMLPSADVQKDLMHKVYSEANIHPLAVEYLEADASGSKDSDKEELNAATEVFCMDRNIPLLIGSVKSNMGNSEPASGFCSLAKVILAMEKGVIPPVIDYGKLNKDIPAFHDGRITVADKPVPYQGGLIAVNNFGFGGSNVHAVFKPNLKTADNEKKHNLPKLVAVSGRTEEAVKNFLEKVEKSDNDYVLHLVHDIHSNGNIRHHYFRGYSVFNTEEPLKEITMYKEVKLPVWFIFPGMGTQWHGMGKDFMEIEIFRESIKKCSAVLEPYGIKMYDIISYGKEEIMDKEIFLVAITVIQIALVDLLFVLDIQPDGIIGHSNGEIVAAYADGALTLEQSVLCAYFKIRSMIEAGIPKGSMASIGLSWSETEARCPPGIFVACDNCDDNVTVSGPPVIVQDFVRTLQSENIFAREVPNSIEVAFHSKYVIDSVPAMKKYLEEIIPSPKKRSPRWISTSVPRNKWDSDIAQTCSSEYLVNNSVSPVYFREALTHIPDNAVVIEVSPHCLFQSILKRALPSDCINIGLCKRLYPKNVEFFMCSVGKLYNLGLQPRIQVLYPKIEYPVPRGTPSLSPMVEWMHSNTWRTYTISDFQSSQGSSKLIFSIFPNREKHQFLKGHVIDGHKLYPAAGYLWLAWNGLSFTKMKRVEELPVRFENVHFHRATHLADHEIEIHFDLLTESGDFELRESNDLIASGRVVEDQNNATTNTIEELLTTDHGHDIVLNTNDIYKELRLRHYEYSGLFKGIVSANTKDLTGELQWNENWIPFLDTMLQFCVFGFLGVRQLCVPTGIEKISINPKAMNSLKNGEKVAIKANKHQRSVKAGGVEISGLNVHVIPTRDQHTAPLLQNYAFVPYENTTNTQFTAAEADKHALTVILQTVLENSKIFRTCIVEVAGLRLPKNLLITQIANICKNVPEYNVELNEVVNDAEEYSKDETLSLHRVKLIAQDSLNKLRNEDIHLLVGKDILGCNENQHFNNVTEFLKPGAFILLEESQAVNVSKHANNWELVCHYLCTDKQLLLFRVMDTEVSCPLVVSFTEKNLNWIEKLKSAIKESENDERRIIIVSQGEKHSGILGLVTSLKKEISGKRIRCVFIRDETAQEFSISNPFYSSQLKKELLMNVYSNKSWGNYHYINLEETSGKETEFAHVDIQTIGNMNTLTWIQSPISKLSNKCYVYYSALNFKDVMLASGKLPVLEETMGIQLGLEFSGRDINGQRICGIVENFGLSTVTNPQVVLKVPDHWTLEEAATVPIVYGTAYYALIIRGKMKRGQTILIHAGCGGVGLAAITIAIHMGVTVYTTVGSQEKRDFLKKRFPQLTDRNIANSRDTSFEQHIMRETKWEGVDLVLNSLAEEKLQASLRCLKQNGKFLEIGKYDLAINAPLGLSLFLKNISFHGITFDKVLKEMDESNKILKLMEEQMESGIVQPLPATVFSDEKVPDAFRFLASAKHIGKVLIQVREEESDRVAKPALKTMPAFPRVYFNSENVYIIIGGLGGFGLELANYIVIRGARKLVLSSRTGITNGYQASRVDMWKSLGVGVVISTADCTKERGATQLITDANKFGDVGGIFNLAVVLKDDHFINLTEDDFQTSCKPKINITKNLDAVSKELCPNLEYFVVFSSIVSGLGNSQQCNYSLANSVVERICEARKSAGLPALAIQWGPVDDVGIVAEITDGRSVEILGLVSQKISSCLSVLDTLLIQKHPIVSSMILVDKTNKISGKDGDILELIGVTMGISNIKEMSLTLTLAQLGADSFMVTAIQHTLEKDSNKILSTDEIRNITLGQIQELSKKKEHVGLNVLLSGLEKATDAPNDTLPIYIPTEVLVKLPSSSMSAKSNANVFFIHPSQGGVVMLESLASIIPAHVWGLQCTADCPCDSLQELASHYIQHIKSVQQNGPFIICSYSLGAPLSFEIGLQLKNLGEIVTVIMLDGAVQVNVFFDIEKVSPNFREKLTNEVISLTMFLFLCGYTKIYETYAYLLAIKTWEEQVLSVTKIVCKDINVPEDQVKQALTLYHRRFVTYHSYNPTEKFSGDMILIKSNNFKDSSNVGKDYRLKEVCVKDVILHEIDDSHYGIIKNEESLKIIQTIFKTVIEKYF